jgi:hypothetical protein
VKGTWHSIRGDRPAHWHEHVQREDGTTFWAALSRCGMQRVVPSVLSDIVAWHAQYPDAPWMDGAWRCRLCVMKRAVDRDKRRIAERLQLEVSEVAGEKQDQQD